LDTLPENEDDHDRENKDDDDDDTENVTDAVNFAKNWDPQDPDAPAAPEGWFFPGFMAFVCFGPTSRYFSVTLQMGGIEKHQAIGRNQLRKQQKEREAVERVSEGTKRGVDKDQQMRLARQSALVSQEVIEQMLNDKTLRERELKLLAISKQFDMVQKMVDTKIKLLDIVAGDVERTVQYTTDINSYLVTIEELNQELNQLRSSAESTNAVTNPGVINVSEK
jgi:hypothetical protein